ncbi:hypothetical protein PHLGIDRAFT_124143 [Phlebiopsis gigantea 11061_1 CR5-6]|uniref:Uncharacterized protein n=1 Tax=Phlebiopsis gigantea (strain 11061_1 CR5-6) TaxID=745531 RepID=A0A0C3PW77_PHLG1|nr:hypothetical protein PHLGIDRAFT_124143 [Phlebiopsis gigantea 11061_1 CR5-6]
MPDNFVFTSLFFSIGELYANSFLVSLNLRDSFRKDTAVMSLNIPMARIQLGHTGNPTHPNDSTLENSEQQIGTMDSVMAIEPKITPV